MYGQLTINLYLLKNIKINDCNEELSKLINLSMEKDEYLGYIHKKKKGFKNYSWCTLYPIEKDYIYKSNDVYRFTIRSYDMKLIDAFEKSLLNTRNDKFVVLQIDKSIRGYKKVDELITITPSIITIRDENNKLTSWNKDNSENVLQELSINVFNNLCKKYKENFKEDIILKKEDVIEDINILSNHGLVINYKNIKMLGYKIKVKFKENEIAQKLANAAIVLGLLEKNSTLGCGFVKQ